MSNPFQEHADNLADYQDMLRGADGSGGAMMTVAGSQVPCTTTNVVSDFENVPGGQSPTLMIESVEFLASDLPAGFIPRKGIKFSLKLNPTASDIALMFWHGGLLAGGLIYRFTAVDANYRA